jgi:hypothetical protein
MVAPGFLDNPEVRRWLNGVEPAWTMLEFNSLNALRHEPSAGDSILATLDKRPGHLFECLFHVADIAKSKVVFNHSGYKARGAHR